MYHDKHHWAFMDKVSWFIGYKAKKMLRYNNIEVITLNCNDS